MRTNRTKQILREGRVALGCSQGHLRSAEIPRMMAAEGLDWIFIDTEHGGFSPETVQDVIRSALMTTITPIVRVPDLQYDLVARSLDAGAEGIIFPRVESPEKLAEAVGWTKFPPFGVRGFGLGPPMVGYDLATFDEIMGHANDHTLVVVQIETRTALERCDELAAVPGVDCLMVGPADLSIALGVAGQWEHPALDQAIDQVVACCERNGRWPSIQVRDPVLAAKWMGRGMKLIGCGNDLIMMWQAVRDLAAGLKAARDGV